MLKKIKIMELELGQKFDPILTWIGPNPNLIGLFLSNWTFYSGDRWAQAWPNRLLSSKRIRRLKNNNNSDPTTKTPIRELGRRQT